MLRGEGELERRKEGLLVGPSLYSIENNPSDCVEGVGGTGRGKNFINDNLSSGALNYLWQEMEKGKKNRGKTRPRRSFY